jgi:hypothetical protein
MVGCTTAMNSAPTVVAFRLATRRGARRDLLRKVGFRQVEVLHKTSVFAAFGAWK